MNVLAWLVTPIRAYRDLRNELKSLRAANITKLAILNADIVSGKISGAELDAVTECLEAQSVNLKKRETDKLRKDGP